jgi:hypothetical protein
VVVEVPDNLLAFTDHVFYPLSHGVVQFDEGAGLEELRAAWLTLSKHIRAVEPS